MSFVSYAQNFEDVIIWRALKHINKGFYIDVGANDPTTDSVTKAFYDRGWRGINVEPVGQWYDKLLDERPQDINLKLALGEEKGSIDFFEIPNTGLSTNRKSFAKQHEKRRGFKSKKIKVPTDTLTSILKKYDCTTIHFLKIDVEGAERAVIQGMDLKYYRPWVIIIEANLPDEVIENAHEWEALLLKADYVCGYSDGLNRFYVAQEHSELLPSFRYPPNVFDDFIKINLLDAELRSQQSEERTSQAEAAASQAEAVASQAEERVSQAEERVSQAEERVSQAEAAANSALMQYHLIVQSRTWRMTAALRYAADGAKWFARGGVAWLTLKPGSRPQRTAVFGLLYLRNWVSVRPKVKTTVASILQRFPHFNYRLKRLLSAQYKTTPVSVVSDVKLPCDRYEKIYYYYVDHTIALPANTGVQRVTRMLAKQLVELGKDIRFVKWSDTKNSLVFINQTELQALSQWNGPELSLLESSRYKHEEQPFLRRSLSTSWLIVPEVPHITFNERPLTGPLLDNAQRLGFKVAAIFYDDIPKYRPELSMVSQKHHDYMRELLRVDVVFSISRWANDDLLSFANDEGANPDENWAIPFPLPAESVLSQRVLGINNAYEKHNIILSVGSITPHKNQLSLVHAFNSYCEKTNTNWKLFLVGHISQEVAPEIQKIVQKNPNICILGGRSDSELKELYTSCSFTVFPSVIEGFGLPIVESLWFGKPCIFSNGGAMAELSGLPGCIAVDTTSTDILEETIKTLIENPRTLRDYCEKILRSELSTWKEYAQRFCCELDCREMVATDTVLKRQRIFWLGGHKLLVETELQRLRKLGYEVFNPAYLTPIEDQSISRDWDGQQPSTLPAPDFKKLAEYNFFYNDISEEISEILNKYFSSVIVTCSPAWVAPVLKVFCGKVIFRTYGQPYLMSQELENIGMKPYIENNGKFIFMPFSEESIQDEAPWLTKNFITVPYCIQESLLKHESAWRVEQIKRQEIILTCPNIKNPYFAEHYQFLKNNFHEPHYKFYGVQLHETVDPQIVGTLERNEQILRFQQSAGYLYTYSDSVCYLPPIEMMLVGGPVLFLTGSLLDKFFPEDAPGRCHSIEEAKVKVSRLLDFEKKFIYDLQISQSKVLARYHPHYVWPEFDRVVNNLIPLSSHLKIQ